MVVGLVRLTGNDVVDHVRVETWSMIEPVARVEADSAAPASVVARAPNSVAERGDVVTILSEQSRHAEMAHHVADNPKMMGMVRAVDAVLTELMSAAVKR